MEISRVVGVIAFAVVLVAGLALGQRRGGPPKVSGIVEADEVRVGSRVGGRVQAVHVAEGAAVKKAERLLSLEPYDLAERIAMASAELEARRSALARLESGTRPEEVAQARAQKDEAQARLDEVKAGPRAQEIAASRHALELAAAELELAGQEKERLQRLRSGGTASEDQLDLALTKWKVASARVDTSREQLALLQEGSRREVIAQAEARLRQAEAALALAEAGTRKEDVARARFEVVAAEAQVESLRRAEAELVVLSPLDGVVGALDLRPGDLVAPNAPVASVLDLSALRVRAYVPSTFLARVREGQTLDVQVDGYPGRTFPGTVTFLSRQAEFAPSNIQTPEERVQQVFRIEVSLQAAELRPGMSADVLLPPAPPAS